ncbi:AsmA family protein [Chitinibacter bivalviorum]|uniref:AsmA family protein n=1 Tax=Chitinibacter bivalviorum TaxID=2739434 RepID=A0A7H9BM55_9NEIS|nr:AsmA family protein [Chitinibacter bivalviorum]QLG89703.1 AsmA family protein [Chitinibacter bivalviorum]
MLSNTKASIGDISFSYSPAPVFTFHNVVLDSPETAHIGAINIPVTAHNILNLGEHLRDITLSQGDFSRSFALDIPNRLHPNQGGAVKIDRLNLSQVSVKLEKGTIGPVDGQLRFKADGNIDDLLVTSDQGRAELQVQPSDGGTFKVQFNAKGWASPLGHPIQFEFLKLIGTANADGINISDIRADLYGGLVTGNAQLNWNQGWNLTGQLFGKNIQAEPLIKVFSSITRASGRMNADATFRYQGTDYNTLFKQPQIVGRFILQDGMLSNFDLVTPLKSQSPTVQNRGGQTNFNTLAGGININGKIVQFRALALDAGKLRSRGEILIRDNTLSGNIASQLAAGAVVVSNQLKVAGSLDSPELRSGGSYRPSSEAPTPVEDKPEAHTEAVPQ